MLTRTLWLCLLSALLSVTPARSHSGNHPTGLDECDDAPLALAWFHLYGTGIESSGPQDPFEPQEYRIRNDAPPGYTPKATVKIAWATSGGHITRYDDFIVTVKIGDSRSYINTRDPYSSTYVINPYIDGWSGVFSVTIQHMRCPFSMTARAHWSMTDPCASCSTITCAGKAEIGSVDFGIPVGITDFGRSPIQLEYHSDQISNEGVAKLAVRGPIGVNGATAHKTADIITGVTTGDHYATVTPDPSPEDPNRFRVDVSYDKNDPANTIFRQAVVENVVLQDGTPAIRYSDTVAGKTDTHTFIHPDANTWVLDENDLRRTTRSTTQQMPTSRTYRHLIEERSASGTMTPVSVRDEEQTRYSWGWETTREVRDPGGKAVTTIWDYCSTTEFSAPDGSITGRGSLQSITLPTGLTRTYEYYDTDPLDPAFSRLIITREAFAGTADVKETRLHTDTSATGLATTQREEIWINGHQVEHTDIVGSAPGGNAWRTETRYPSGGGTPQTTRYEHESNPNSLKERTTIFPDGTVEMITGWYGAGFHVSSIYRGVDNPNSRGLPLLTGTEKLTLTNPAGQVVRSASFRIRNGTAYRLEDRLATAFDLLTRPTTFEVSHGTRSTPSWSETIEYGCCGISRQTGEDGIPVHFYYDDLDRLRKTHRNGLATEIAYDGLTTRTHLYPETIPNSFSFADAANEAASATRDLAGNLTTEASRSPQDDTLVTTTIQTNYNPGNGIGRQVIRTLPQTADDQGVSPTVTEEFYLDGQLAKRTGPLVADRQTTYAANATGITSTSSRLDTNGNPYESVTTQFDWMRRPVSRTFSGDADNNGQPDVESIVYDAGGRPLKQVDPDGATRLWDYDLLNETTISAIDLNGNNLLDPDLDEVRTRRTGSSLNSGGDVIVWSEELVRETPGSDTLLTRSETSADGLESWHYSHDDGNSTLSHSQTTRLANLPGAWDTIIRRPDQTSLVQQHRHGLLDNDERFDASGVSLSTRTYQYDSLQRPVQVDDSGGPSSYTTYVSPLLDRVATSAVGPRLTAYTYDHRGRTTVVDEPDTLDASGATIDNRRTTTYWPHGAPRDASGTPGHHLAYTYDDAHRLETLTTHGSTAATTRWEFDSDRGWLTHKKFNSPTPGQGSGPAFTYSAAGRLASRTSAGAVVTSHSYGTDGRLTRTDYNDGTAATVILERDRRGRVTRLGDAGGERHFTYNTQSALDSESYDAGHVLAGWTISQSRDSLQRLSALTLQAGGTDQHSATYSYDNAGRLDAVESQGLTAYYHYDTNHQRVGQLSIINAQGPVLYANRSYDALNRLDRISYHNGDLHGALQVYSDYQSTRDAFGRITSTTLHDKTQWRYAYHATGELASGHRFLDASSTTRVAGHNHAWTYDGVGNRLSAHTGGDATGSNLQASTSSSNPLNQFTSIQRPGAVDIFGEAPLAAEVLVNGTAAARQGPFFRRELSADNASGPVWQPVTIQSGGDTATGHLLIPAAQTAPLHDLDGNLTHDGIHQYSWDAENRLTQVETTGNATSAGLPYSRITYTYDSDSRCLQRLRFDAPAATLPAESTRYLYAGWRCLGELDANNQLTRTLTWGLDNQGSFHLGDGNGALLWLHDHPTNETHLTHFDGNGNVTGLSSAQSRQQTAHYLYSPFGKLLAATGPYATQNPYRFSTHHQDPETGLVNYGYRHLNPDTGTWLNRDPLGEIGGTNLYAFLGNDGVNQYDVLGTASSSFVRSMAVAAGWGAVGSTFLGRNAESHINKKRANEEARAKGLSECDRLRDLLEKAKLARAAHDTFDPPPGWTEIDSIHHESGLDASVFRGPDQRIAISFRGTTDGKDWESNFLQGAGFIGDQYREILKDPRNWATKYPDAEVIGHSLGGGLASVYGTKHERKTTTFNASGIHWATTDYFGIGGYSDYQKYTESHVIRGDILNFAQDLIPALAPDSKGRRFQYWSPERKGLIGLHNKDIVVGAIEKQIEKCCKGR